MTYLKTYKSLIRIFISLLVASSAMAESSKEYAMMGQSTWVAFECSALASKTGNAKEQERLFSFGYEEGLKFINALKSEKIKSSDLKSEVPLSVLWSLQGPTPDFMLGRVFEVAMEHALKNVYKTGDTHNDEEMQKTIAEREFSKRNCNLIGR